MTGVVVLAWWSIRGILTLDRDWKRRCWALLVIDGFLISPFVFAAIDYYGC